MKADSGNLLQIFIPKDLINKLVYISEPLGIPYRWNNNIDLKAIINSNNNITTLDVLNFYKNANFPTNNLLYKIDQLQARILMINEFFQLNNGIKIFQYTTSQIQGEFGADYKKALRLIIGKMIINYVLKNQEIIKKEKDIN